MANIPGDVIQLSILPRLPVKSLVRFKSVSKSWQTWISSPDFIRLHRHHARSSDKNCFLIMLDQLSHTIHLHKLDSLSAPPLLLPYPKPARCTTTPMPVEIVAFCEALLLLRCSPRSNRTIHLDMNLIWTRTHEIHGLILLNPSTGSYHEIPQTYLINHHLIYGLYFDEANDDYKVATICQSYNFPPTHREVMVYSSKKNKWTLIEQKLDMFYRIKPNVVCVMDHLLHTIFISSNDDTRIGCFDIVAEKWTNDVPLPDNYKCYKLCVFDGLLCVGVEELVGPTRKYQVWVMKEYGVKESWVKLLNIDNCNICGPHYLPVTYCEGSRHKILCRNPCSGKLFWYNLRNKKSKKIELDGCTTSLSGHNICKQSLVNFAGGRQISLRRLEIKEETSDEEERKRVSKFLQLF